MKHTRGLMENSLFAPSGFWKWAAEGESRCLFRSHSLFLPPSILPPQMTVSLDS